MISKIYLIINLVNNKKYVGKTLDSLEKRFKQHINEANKERSKHRPLYRAINKYGKENFVISLIEHTNLPEEREIYWIDFYRNLGHVYNVTNGGDGKSYVNTELVLYYLDNITKNCAKIAKILEYDPVTIRKIAKNNNRYENATLMLKSSLTEEQLSLIKQLYVPKFFGKRKIAKKLNISVNKVEYAIDYYIKNGLL